MNDKVNSPKHYTSHPSGIECIQITEHYNFCIGNAIKYLWRQGLKEEYGYSQVEKQKQDLLKSIWYINRHIESLEKSVPKPLTNKQKVDLLNTIMKPKASEQVFPDPPTRDITDLEKKFIRDLAEGNIKPGQIKAGGAWMLDREAAARATIAEVQEPKTWLDCND